MAKSLDEVIERLQYKADNIKARLEPGYFTECIDYLKSLPREDTPVSNADMIRSMTDEQLAEQWPCPYDTAGSNIMPCMLDDDVKGMPDEAYCRKCMMEWLKREVEK
jgi:hypothetical protein